MKSLRTSFHIFRMNLIKTISFLLFFTLGISSFAQELNLTVTIDDSQYSLPDRSVFDELKTGMEEFVNNKRWTEDVYEEYYERINYTLTLTVKENSTQTGFFCQAFFSCSRPVFNSGYETASLNFIDKYFNFTYVPGQPLEFNDNAYTNELTSLLAFYSYIALATDYNTFSPDGGKEYFLQALNVKNVIPSPESSDGWNRDDDVNNRTWLIENAINPQFDVFHKAVYSYHREGLDIISDNQKMAQQKILESIKEIEKVFDLNPQSILISSFFLSKRIEMVAIFKEADSSTKNVLIPLLRKMDPANSEKYQKIRG